MSEVSMRNTMKGHFMDAFPTGHWSRIEDTCALGVPDINFMGRGIVETWVEAKNFDPEKLPKRSSTPVKIGLKIEQAIWLRTRSEAGGRVLVATKMGREWFIHDNGFKELHLGLPLEELRAVAKYNWIGNFDIKYLIS